MENELYPIKHSIVSIRERKQAIETACTSMRTHLDQVINPSTREKTTNEKVFFFFLAVFVVFTEHKHGDALLTEEFTSAVDLESN